MKKKINHLYRSINQFFHGEEEALEFLKDYDLIMNNKSQKVLGFPVDCQSTFTEFLHWWDDSHLSKLPINDVGNPDSASPYSLNTRPFEMDVIQYFASLFSLEHYWGYVSSGGTQSNEQALYMGREALIKHGEPILYVSEEAHYSIQSLARILRLQVCEVAAQENGEIDYEDLDKKLISWRPALFSLSIGTTFKGGIDRIEKIIPLVNKRGIKHVFYHADAALFGGFLPYYPGMNKPDLNFTRFPYDSIAISGHKFFGTPVPVGIFLTRSKYLSHLKPEHIEYIDSKNYTIPCSRSGLTTLLLWWKISTIPTKEFVQQSKQIIENAKYLHHQLKKRGYPAWLNAYSNTVFFKAPSSKSLSQSWNLSTCQCKKLGQLAHIVVMQHVTKELLDKFLHELDRLCPIQDLKTA